MANTGIKNVLTLDEGTMPCPPCTPLTGNSKPNAQGDPNYIAPYLDLGDCPVVPSLDCPVDVIATGFTDGTAEYEFSITPAGLAVPNLAKIKVKFMLVAVETASDVFVLPNVSPNYFTGSVSGLAASTTYTIEIDYLNSSDALLPGGNCVTGKSVTTNVTP